MSIQRQSPYQIQPTRDSSLGYVDLLWDILLVAVGSKSPTPSSLSMGWHRF